MKTKHIKFNKQIKHKQKKIKLAKHIFFTQKEREKIIKNIKSGLLQFKNCNRHIRKDRDIILNAVKEYSYDFIFVPYYLKSNKSFVLEVVKQSGWSIEQASSELRNDKEVALVAVKQNGFAINSISKELQNDKEIQFEAFKECGYFLNQTTLFDLKEYIASSTTNNIEILREDVENLTEEELELWEEKLHRLPLFQQKDYYKKLSEAGSKALNDAYIKSCNKSIDNIIDFFHNPLKKEFVHSTSLLKTKNIAIATAMTQF